MSYPWYLLVFITSFSCFLHNRECRDTKPLFTFPSGDPFSKYAEALPICRDRLPDGQSYHDELVTLMENTGVWTTWLAWKRSSSPWSWLSGQAVTATVRGDNNEGYDCGVLDSGGQLQAQPCHHTLPVICEFSDIPCSKTYAAAYCVSSNGTTLLVAPELQGWFTARAFCRHLAGDLASLHHKKYETLAKSLVKKLPDGPYWIGVRRNLWKISSSLAELEHMRTNQWDADQPGSGDCVVLHQEGGRGFWRTTRCTDGHRVICTTSQIHTNGTIVFPRRNYTESAGADISIDKDVMKYNLTVEQLCAKKHVASFTPKELLENMNHIAHYMRASNISSVWLPWKRSNLSSWTWLEGDPYSGKIIEDAPGLCASPDIFLGASTMYIIPCHRQTVGYICQFNDGNPCWQKHHPFNCLELGSSTLVVGIRVQSWYVASALCTSLGGQLAQLPQIAMVQAVLDFHKNTKTLQTTNFFHIGLQKLAWRRKPKETLYVHNLWKRGEPMNNVMCSVMQFDGHSLLWRSANCTERHAIICRAHLATTADITTSSGQLFENVTTSVDGTLLTTKPHQLQPSLILLLGAPFLTIILAGAIVVCAFGLHRRFKSRQTMKVKSTHAGSIQENEDMGKKNTSSSLSDKQHAERSETFPLLSITDIEQSSNSKDEDRTERKIVRKTSDRPYDEQIEVELTSDHLKWPSSTHMGSSMEPLNPRSLYEIFSTELLCEERRQRLQEKHNELVDLMDITNSTLLESLIAHQVITVQQKQKIECESKNEDQVAALIKIMNKMDNRSFEKMVDILDSIRQGAVVHNILLTPGDFIHAREKLANYYLAEFTDVQLYSTEKDDKPTKLEKIYVSMTWKAIKHSTNALRHSDQDTKVSSYFDLFHKLKNRKETHLVVTGKPGAGKTTFVKRVCHQWAELVLEKTVDYSEDGVQTLECYTFVIPVILRLVNHNETLLEIIKSQFSSLTTLDFNCISTVITKYPQDVLVILDGYDELSIVQSCLHQTISKEKNKEITLVVTTRPHGLTLIKQLGGNAIEQLAELCGFSRDQIVKYIALYFYKNAQLGTELKKCLFDDRLDLLELAYTPIHLQMICIVWNAHQNLGSNLVNLYLKFILCLLDHFEKKCLKERSKEEDILQNHTELLTKVGRLANQWQGSQLTTTFSYDTLRQICGNHLQSTITLGCITKYHPSNELEKSHWTFTHLTLQEFFVAHFLSQTTDDQWFKDFVNCCSQINRLERNSVILKFLAGLAPNMTNNVLQAVVKRTKNKEECTRLLKVLLDIIPEYNRLADVDLPVPRHVDADDIKQSESALRKIFLETSEENLSNVYGLTTENFAKSLYTKCLPYIAVLNLTVNSGQCIASMVDKARSMTKLASFNINIKTPTRDSRKEVDKSLAQLLGGSHMKTVTSVSLKGSRVVNHAKSAIDKAPKLQKLALELHSKEIREKDIESLCSLIEQKESICEVHLEIDNINHALLKISSRVRLTLMIKEPTLEALKSFVEILKLNNSKTGISRLILHNIVKGTSSLADKYRTLPSDFENHHPKSEENLGKHLGYLILHSPSLTMLDFSKCVLRSRAIQGMDEAIPADQPLSIKKLSLLLVELSHNETHLRKLLQGMPQLQSLQLHGCEEKIPGFIVQIKFTLRIYDWKTVCDSIKLYASLRDLQLTKINIDKEAASALGELWHHVTHLQVLSVWGCKMKSDAVPLLLGGPGDDRLQQLRVLDVNHTNLGDEGVRHLASRLPTLSSLQALGVAYCNCYDIATLLDLVTSLPHSLTHLDAHDFFCSNPSAIIIVRKENTSMVQLTKHKDRLACLQRLNIGDRSYDEGLEDTVEAIRQELLTVNPDIQVYHDKEEDLWKMYIDNKGDPF